jgi:hypothetical protein
MGPEYERFERFKIRQNYQFVKWQIKKSGGIEEERCPKMRMCEFRRRN